MKIGVPKEIKTNENRIALVPAGAEALTAAGHSVFVEKGAGEGSGFPDELYVQAGAKIVPDAAAAWGEAEMVMKVKEPIEKEWQHLRSDLMVFTYFHFAADEELTRAHIQYRIDKIKEDKDVIAVIAATRCRFSSGGHVLTLSV